MDVSFLYPNDYLIFAIGKIFRRKAAYNAYERHGYVWYKPLQGAEYIHELCRKAAEESAEVVEAHNLWQFTPTSPQRRTGLIAELGDLSDVMDVLEAELQGEYAGVHTAGNFNMVVPRWKKWAGAFSCHPAPGVPVAEVAECVAYTRNTIGRYLRQWSITPEELALIRNRKDADKGPLLQGRVEYVALPASDEWIPHFQKYFRPADAASISAPVPAHPHLLAVTPPG